MPDIPQKPYITAPTAIDGGPSSEQVTGAPDYPLEPVVHATTPGQLKAFADPIRSAILDLVLERAATTTELASSLGRPRGTIDHHLKALEKAGLIKVVRTRQVRAMTERYWGRTGRTIILHQAGDDRSTGDFFVRQALDETTRIPQALADTHPNMSTLRHARIPIERAQEFADRIEALGLEFSASTRGGDTVFGLVMAIYPTDQPRLPDV